MKSIVFIETNKSGSCLDGLIAAKKLGYFIHLLTAKKQFIERTFPFADEIHHTNLKNKDLIFTKIKKISETHHIEVIISFLDSYVSIAAGLHQVFCKSDISKDAFLLMEDKIKTRNQLQSKPYSPFYFISKKTGNIKDDLLKLKQMYPLVLKSPTSTGSKDVYLIQNENQMINRIQFLRKKSSIGDLLIEEYLSGPQYLVEAIVYNGEVQIAAVFEQEITKLYKFIVTGYSISPTVEKSIYSSISAVTSDIINDFGLKNGNCHLELRLVNGQWKLIEVNPRISGGAMNKLIKEAFGFNYAEEILKVYRGDRPELIKEYENSIFAHFFTVDFSGELLEVTGLEEALASPGISEVFIRAKKGQILSPPLSMGNRYGYVLAKGRTNEEAKSYAIHASRKIQFHLAAITN